jgi:hypothetical protein
MRRLLRTVVAGLLVRCLVGAVLRGGGLAEVAEEESRRQNERRPMLRTPPGRSTPLQRTALHVCLVVSPPGRGPGLAGA